MHKDDYHREITALKEHNAILEKKIKELEQFTYHATHDLKEPMRTVTNFIEILNKEYASSLDDKAKRYLHFISDAGERLTEMITGLSDFNRIGLDDNSMRVNCHDILQHVQEELKPQIENSGTTFEITNLPTVTGNDREIRLLFQNLISNAIKFQPEGNTPHIQISCEKADDSWTFAISDNGIGIDENYYDRIFGMFARLHPRRKYKGSGIGLAVAKKIVEQHSGKIWVTSKPEYGATFYVTLNN